jgi:hypothetical protein
MTTVKAAAPTKEMPECEELAPGFTRYRVIVDSEDSQVKGTHAIGVMSSDYELKEGDQDPLMFNIAPKIFGDGVSFCHGENSSVFIDTEQLLTRKGISDPHSLPFCTSTQKALRMVMKGERGVVLHPDSFALPNWNNPSDEMIPNIKPYLYGMGATGMCHRQVSLNPARYGLFLMFDGVDAELLAKKVELSERVEKIIECQRVYDETVSEIGGINYTAPAVGDLKIFEGLLHEKSAGRILKAAEAIFPLSPTWETFTLITITKGLFAGISSDDYVEFIADVGMVIDDTSELPHAIAGFTALRIARMQAMERREKGYADLAPSAVEMTIEVERAVRQGLITLRSMTRKEQLENVGSRGIYLSNDDTAVFNVLRGSMLDGQFLSVYIHELYHAYQDMKGVSASMLENERPAYMIGYGLGSYMEDVHGAVYNDLVAQNYLAAKKVYRGLTDDARNERDRCAGLPEDVIETKQTFREWRRASWNDYSIGGALLVWHGTQIEPQLFTNHYSPLSAKKIITYDSTSQLSLTAKNNSALPVWALSMLTDGLIESVYGAKENYDKAVADNKNPYYEAGKYLLFLNKSASNTIFLDEDLYVGLVDQLYADIERISYDLTQATVVNDGVPGCE